MCEDKDLGLFCFDLRSPKPLMLRFYHYPLFSSSSLVVAHLSRRLSFGRATCTSSVGAYTLYTSTLKPLGGINLVALKLGVYSI